MDISRERGYKIEETKAYLGLGGAYKLSNQIQQANQYYKKGLEIATGGGYILQKTESYLALGDAYKLNNQFQLAIQHYENASKTARERGYKLQETNAYLGLGDAYRLNNQSQLAIQHYEKALEIARERGYETLARNATEELSRITYTGTVRLGEDLKYQVGRVRVVDDVAIKIFWILMKKYSVHLKSRLQVV